MPAAPDLPQEAPAAPVKETPPEKAAPEVPSEPVPAEEKPAQDRVLWLDARALSEEDFAELLDTVSSYEGDVRTKILHGGKRYEFAVHLSRAFEAEVRSFLPAACVKLV